MKCRSSGGSACLRRNSSNTARIMVAFAFPIPEIFINCPCVQSLNLCHGPYRSRTCRAKSTALRSKPPPSRNIIANNSASLKCSAPSFINFSLGRSSTAQSLIAFFLNFPDIFPALFFLGFLSGPWSAALAKASSGPSFIVRNGISISMTTPIFFPSPSCKSHPFSLFCKIISTPKISFGLFRYMGVWKPYIY